MSLCLEIPPRSIWMLARAELTLSSSSCWVNHQYKSPCRSGRTGKEKGIFDSGGGGTVGGLEGGGGGGAGTIRYAGM